MQSSLRSPVICIYPGSYIAGARPACCRQTTEHCANAVSVHSSIKERRPHKGSYSALVIIQSTLIPFEWSHKSSTQTTICNVEIHLIWSDAGQSVRHTISPIQTPSQQSSIASDSCHHCDYWTIFHCSHCFLHGMVVRRPAPLCRSAPCERCSSSFVCYFWPALHVPGKFDTWFEETEKNVEQNHLFSW